MKRLRVFLKRFHPQDMACTPEEEWEASVPDRAQRVLAHMKSITEAMSEEARASTMAANDPTPAFRKRFARCFLGMKEEKQP